MQKAPHANCDLCPLKDRPLAKSVGDPDSDIAVVSRSPGYYEAMNGKCFAGPSGKVLDHLLKLQGRTLNDVLATNLVLCQSDGPQEDPGYDLAVQCCAARLNAELENAKTIIAAGAEAVAVLIDEPGGVSGNRGYAHDGYSAQWGYKQRIIATNNPAVIMRDDGAYPDMVRDFRLAINPLPAPALPQVRIIEDVDEAKDAVEQMLQMIEPEMLVACDLETRGVDGKSGLSHTAIPVCAGFSIRPERAVVFGENPCLHQGFLTDYLSKLYTIDSVKYTWHNGKYDTKILLEHGIAARVDEDTMLLSWVCDERPGNPESGAGGHSLEWLLKDELGWPKYESDSVKHFKKTGDFYYYGTSPQQVARAKKELYTYNGMDTAGTLALYPVLLARARAEDTYERPYKSLLVPRLTTTLARVELQGNIYDADAACDILEYEVWPKLDNWRGALKRISQTPTLNPNSPKQLAELLYDKWGLKHNLDRPKIERKGKVSTDKYVREEIKRGDFTCNIDRDVFARFSGILSDFKELDTQRGTFLEGLVIKRHSNGRIYTDFKIHGTESGRVSSSNPNMQNVTRPKEGLPNIRRVFKPDPGCVFVSADLSQAELRTIAVLSGDEGLQSIYLDTNRSLHKEVARDFYGADYTYEQYVRAKNINFGVVYWQSAYTFAQMYHMPIAEAEKFVKWWWERFPQVWEWTKSIEKKVLEDGELQSPFGHKRRFYVIPADQSGRLHTIKQGINFLPQNIAGNITLWALCNIADKLDWRIAQPRITVHDNIVLNARQDYAEEIAALVKHEMEAAALEAIGWDFPYIADVSIGPTWGDLEEIKVAA